jgi:hypothetical protein
MGFGGMLLLVVTAISSGQDKRQMRPGDFTPLTRTGDEIQTKANADNYGHVTNVRKEFNAIIILMKKQ